jgi:hypothetical protein
MGTMLEMPKRRDYVIPNPIDSFILYYSAPLGSPPVVRSGNLQAPDSLPLGLCDVHWAGCGAEVTNACFIFK